ncbi:MAG: hypothetical protein AB1489_30510 [Acidobacteriota bacterium]
MTCKKEDCQAINVSEQGAVTGVTEVKNGGYFLIIQWDSHSGYQTL